MKNLYLTKIINNNYKGERKMTNNGLKIGITIVISLIVLGTFVAGASFASQKKVPTFVILINGYTVSGVGYWEMGVDIYQQLVHAGYIVGIMSYYGPFAINFSNGYQYIIPNFNGTNNTPIEVIAAQLANALITIKNNYGNVNFDIVAHSMGGLITMYMLENYILPINLKNVITIGSPFEGTNAAYVAYFLGMIGVSGYQNPGYQDKEMMPGSAFITKLNYYQSNVTSNYPKTVMIAYAGNYDPWWGYILFFGADNDGLVPEYSALGFHHNYQFVFPDLHSPGWDKYTFRGICFFEDQNVANTILNNLSGNY
ncbi:MAG: alpha/beta fold hydrolase [Thermoplasmata archaeon]